MGDEQRKNKKKVITYFVSKLFKKWVMSKKNKKKVIMYFVSKFGLKNGR